MPKAVTCIAKSTRRSSLSKAFELCRDKFKRLLWPRIFSNGQIIGTSCYEPWRPFHQGCLPVLHHLTYRSKHCSTVMSGGEVQGVHVRGCSPACCGGGGAPVSSSSWSFPASWLLPSGESSSVAAFSLSWWRRRGWRCSSRAGTSRPDGWLSRKARHFRLGCAALEELRPAREAAQR